MPAENIRDKKNPPALPTLRFARFEEGPAAQIMHIGPFSQEWSAIETMHDFIADTGRQRSGKHHEICLSDIRPTAPEKLKTILRQPLR